MVPVNLFVNFIGAPGDDLATVESIIRMWSVFCGCQNVFMLSVVVLAISLSNATPGHHCTVLLSSLNCLHPFLVKSTANCTIRVFHTHPLQEETDLTFTESNQRPQAQPFLTSYRLFHCLPGTYPLKHSRHRLAG